MGISRIPSLDRFSLWEIGEKLFNINDELHRIWTSGKFSHDECSVKTTELLRRITNVFQKYIFAYKASKVQSQRIPDVSWRGFQKLFAKEGLHHICTTLMAYDPEHPKLHGLVVLLRTVDAIIHEQLFKEDGPNLELLKKLRYGKRFAKIIFEFDHTPYKSIASSMLFSLIRILRKIQHEKTERKTIKLIRKFIISDLLIDHALVKKNESFNNKHNLLTAFDLLNTNFDSIDHLFSVNLNIADHLNIADYLHSAEYLNHLSRIRDNTLRLGPFDTSEAICKKIGIIRQMMDILGFTQIIDRGRAPQQTGAASSSELTSRDVKFDFSENTRISRSQKTHIETILIELQRAYLFQQNLNEYFLCEKALRDNDSYSSQVYEKMTQPIPAKTIHFARLPCSQSLHSSGDHKLKIRYDLINLEKQGTQHPLGLDTDLDYSDFFIQDSARCIYLIADKNVRCSFSLSQEENREIIQDIYLHLEREFSKGREFIQMTNYLHQMSTVPVCGSIHKAYSETQLNLDFFVGGSKSHPFFYKVYIDAEGKLISRIAMIYEVFVPSQHTIPKSYHVQLTDMIMSPELDQILSANYVSQPFGGESEDAFVAAEGHLYDILTKGLDSLLPWDIQK